MVKKKSCPQCLRLIAEGTRTEIIHQLRKKPNRVGKIEAHFSLTQPTISHHLKVLQKAGMIFAKRQGREIHYFLNKKYPCKKCFIFKLPFKV